MKLENKKTNNKKKIFISFIFTLIVFSISMVLIFRSNGYPRIFWIILSALSFLSLFIELSLMYLTGLEVYKKKKLVLVY
jgi:hypothetical protein